MDKNEDDNVDAGELIASSSSTSEDQEVIDIPSSVRKPDSDSIGISNFKLNAEAKPFVPLQQHQASHGLSVSGSAVGYMQIWKKGSEFSRKNPNFGVSSLEEKESAETLRVRLSEQLEHQTYECMICCDKIRIQHRIWSCHICFQIFHLPCLKKWAAKSLEAEGIWRCPGCQFVNEVLPVEYRCFCGKVANPRTKRQGDDIPHSCGEACRKSRGGSCSHKCTLPCHPGPCPPCPRNITIKCNCGSEQKTIRCGTVAEYKCTKHCEQVLNCGIHKCLGVCHSGLCQLCSEQILLRCFCGDSTRDVPCTIANREQSAYSCGGICGKNLSCGNHKCEQICHSGPCEAVCPWDPRIMKKCPCGKTLLSQLSDVLRSSCVDAVAVCTSTCDKVLGCGSRESPHHCKNQCHMGKCPPCQELISVVCRCGGSSKLMRCFEAEQYREDNPLLCERKCKKQRTCQLHKCGNACCVDKEHICLQICGRLLNCGLHTCDLLCHRGKCSPCLQASFEELYCECGHSVLEPPVPCGAKRPACDMPCSRDHPCPHPVSHPCHSEPICPPCTFLTRKWCYGHHEKRSNIPCYLDDVSCGKLCGKKLLCGMHYCMKTCHPGQCLGDGDKCKYACTRQREECGHPCKLSCHEGPCPDSTCKALVKVTCKCGLQKGEMTCVELRKFWTRNLAIKAMGTGNAGEIGLLQRQESIEMYKSLACTDECSRLERNRRFADALNIENADIVGDLSKVEPIYTDFLKTFWKENSTFVVSVEKVFVDLVTSTEAYKATSKSHVFEPAVRDRRRFIHEYAGYFHMDTVSYDPEPQRNVVVTAKKGKSFVPCLLLSSFIQKEIKVANRVAPPPAVNAWAKRAGTGGNASPQSNFQSLNSTGVIKR